VSFRPDNHHRRSIRLRDYDYRQNGVYFVTICTLNREHTFGDITDDGKMIANRFGDIVIECWNAILLHYPQVETDAFVLMPNHLHGIIVISDAAVGARHVLPLPTPQTATFRHPLARSLSSIVGAFKSAVTKHVNILQDTPGAPLWQRNFYDQIIRNESMLHAIRQYIESNPANWAFDDENPLKRPIEHHP
jgi:REP-associated tyrosine transposase